MTDTERLDFIEKHKLETFWTDGLDEWSIAQPLMRQCKK